MDEIVKAVLLMLAVAIGFGLVATAVVLRLQLVKEVIEGKIVFWNNFLPYWNANDFTEKGNKIRRKYNNTYFSFILYFVVLFVLKQYYAP